MQTQADTATRNAMMAPLIAGITGLALGLLFAPRSGRETRERLRGAADQAKRMAEEDLEYAQERLRDGVHHARRVRDHVAEAVKVSKEAAADEAKAMKAESKNSNPTNLQKLATGKE